MDRAELLNRITVNPEVLVGKPTIRGMRISVEQILDVLATGVPEKELLEDYPALEPDDIRAVLLYARDEVESEFRSRHYEVELEEEVIRKLQAQARQKGVTVSRLASDLLREQLVSYG